MSTESKGNSKNKGRAEGAVSTDSMGRMTWNKEYYLAQANTSSSAASGSKRVRPEISGNITSRVAVDFASAEGHAAIVEAGKGAGFVCKVCNMVLTDSTSYVQHLNSGLHQRNSGFAGLPQRSTVEEVRNKLNRLSALKAGRVPPVPIKLPESSVVGSDDSSKASTSRGRSSSRNRSSSHSHSRSRSPNKPGEGSPSSHRHHHHHHHHHHHRHRHDQDDEDGNGVKDPDVKVKEDDKPCDDKHDAGDEKATLSQQDTCGTGDDDNLTHPRSD